ncbi:MAG: DUF5716 family protein [Bacilli bacterium]|nr:DUF5716 family protein [Bacilli bacterium]
MKLFDVIPNNLFTLLTSKNRDVYVSSLLVLHQSFKQEVMIEKEALTHSIVNKLHNELYDLDETVDGSEQLKDIHSKARFLVRKFLETGWIEIEYNKIGGVIEYVTLPPYSIKLLSVLDSLVNEEVKEYDSYMYSMYSSLVYADEKYTAYRFTSLFNVYDKLIEFEETLKSLFHNLKRRYTNLASLKTVNQVLREHFDSYQKEVIKQIYLPLKTKDSINRFKGPILIILTKWLRDESILDEIVKQSLIANQYHDVDEAKLGIIKKINYIVDKLFELEELVDMIDDRNNTYVAAATNKMKYLLKNDRSVKGKLTKIIQALAYDLDDYDENFLPKVEHLLAPFPQQYLNENSLYSRKDAKESRDEVPLEIVTLTDSDRSDMFTSFTNNKDIRKFSHLDIIDYMHRTLEDKKTINSEQIELPDIDALIYTMHAFIKGYDPNIFYKLELHDGMVKNNNFELPNFNFTRRRQ